MTEGLSAGDAARRLGVAVTTLRSWHRRYGLGPGDYSPGRHRRYTDADMTRLDQMTRLVAEGVNPARAARTVLGAPPAAAFDRAGGGHTIAVGRGGEAARGLARAAMRLDAAAMTDIIGASISRVGVVATWDDLVCPLLVGLHGEADTPEPMIAVEHLLSRAVSDAMGAVARPHVTGAVRILLASADEEQHTLALETLAAALGEVGIGSRLLGPRTPTLTLLHTIRRTGPSAVLVWSQAPDTGSPRQLQLLVAVRPRPLLIAAAGPGWPDDGLPAPVVRPASLIEALALLTSGPASTSL